VGAGGDGLVAPKQRRPQSGSLLPSVSAKVPRIDHAGGSADVDNK
jgi:hypothetical protein